MIEGVSARRRLPGGGPVPGGARGATETGGDPLRRMSVPNPAFYRAAAIPLERSQLAQAMIDVAAVLYGFVFVLVTALAISASAVILFLG